MASPFLAGFPGGLMQGLDFGTLQALQQMKLQQAQLQQQQAQQEQQTLGAIGQTLKQNPNMNLGGLPLQQPSGFQQGVGQDVASALSGVAPQGSNPLVLRDTLSSPAAGSLSQPQVPPPQLSSYGGAAGIQGLPGSPSGPSLSGLVASMESSGGRDTASQPPGMVDKVYGQYPGFVQDYGRGPAGIQNFANKMLASNPNATVGDFYSNYVLGTGGTSKTPADLAATNVPGAQGAYRNMENKLASAGISDATPLHLLLYQTIGQSGAKLVQAGVSPPVAQASTDTAKAAGREINPQMWGRSQLPEIFAAVDKANPNAPDVVKVMAALQLNKIAAPEERMAMQVWAKQNQQEIANGFKDLELKIKEQRLKDTENKPPPGGQPYQPVDSDGKPIGPPVQIIGGKASPISGLPAEAGGGLTRVGSKPAGGVSDLQAEFVANYWQATGTLPLGSGRDKETMRAAEKILAARGADPQQLAAAAGSFKADTASLVAAQKVYDLSTAYEKVAEANLAKATEMLHKVAPTNFGAAINRWILNGESALGAKDIPAEQLAVLTLANEYAKVMSGATGAQAATEGSRREAAEQLSPYFAAGQWDQVSNIVLNDMHNKQEGYADQVDVIKTRMGRGGQPRSSASAGGVQPSAGPNFSTMTLEQMRAIPKDQFDKFTPEQIRQMNDRYLELTKPQPQ